MLYCPECRHKLCVVAIKDPFNDKLLKNLDTWKYCSKCDEMWKEAE
jgi:hypothetical protein